MKDKDRYFRTCSLPIATFLYTKEQPVVGVDQSEDPKRKEFVFPRTDFLDELVYKFKFGDRNDSDLLVSVRLYDQARQELLDRLYDDR
jgi:hypothetical protein